MTSVPDLSDLISLSLLPPWTWRDAAERLRAGASPTVGVTELLDRRAGGRPGGGGEGVGAGASPTMVLTELLDRRACGQPERATLDRRALAAWGRAKDRGIDALPWSDPSYPASLAAITDPPFV